MRVVGYISSTRIHEIDREIDLKIQKERIADFCKKQSFNFIYTFEEPQNSTDDNKPALFDLLNKASNKEFDKVVVLKLDILGNDKLSKAWIIDELKKNGVQLYSLTEDMTIASSVNDEETQKRANIIKNKVRDIPSLPEVVTKVMQLVQDPNSSAAQLSKVISHDPGLTSRVLKLVNSAYYGFPKQISSIQHAIMILGFTTIRGLVLSSSIFKIFAPKSDSKKMLDYKQLWQHTLLSAIAAKNINKYLDLQQDEHIFSAAILHDIGKLILDQYDHANFILAYAEASNSFDFNKIINAERTYCGVSHCDIGFLVSEQWNLPLSISESIRCHHSSGECKDEHRHIVGMVSLGNTFAHIIYENKSMDFDYFDQDALVMLGLKESDLTELFVMTNEEVQTIGDLELFFE
ncbi:MAG: HDOD domain-containing protein [Candidatus Gastranaerophilaceae bacterium]